MNIVMAIVVEDELETLDAQLAFHLNAGVDHIVATLRSPNDSTKAILETYSREGYLETAPAPAAVDDAFTVMARVAVEHGADWIVPINPGEFWWPRGESLRDVLAVIPPRYKVVQALVRSFLGRRSGGFFADDLTLRTSLLADAPVRKHRPQSLLRPVYRAEPDLVIDAEDWTLGGARVPLRAWYPIEVFRFSGSATDFEEPDLDARVANGELVVDTRLRDALRQLRKGHDRGFAPLRHGDRRLAFPVPSVVDDAMYAIECAAVGEVDLVHLDGQIRELDLRIAALESRVGPRVRRALRRLARRPS